MIAAFAAFSVALRALLAFACGAAYEAGCTFWVHHAERGNAWRAVAWSCFNALVTVLGVEAFLTGWVPTVAYVAGFGTGTFFAVRRAKPQRKRGGGAEGARRGC